MDQEIEVLPSSSGFHHTQPGPIVRRPMVGMTGGSAYAGGRMLPSQRGAGAPPSLLRVERQLPLSFQRTNQHYDAASRQTTGTRNGKVVLLPRANTAGSTTGAGRVVPRTITPYRMDASGNRYVVTANGQLAQIQPTTRMNMASAPLRRNYLLNQQQQRYQSADVKPFAYSDGGNRIGGYESPDVRQPTYIRQVGGYSSLAGRQLAGGDGRGLHPAGFRRVDYAAVRTSEYRRSLANDAAFRDDSQLVKREPYDWPPRLIPVGGAPGGGYRVASNNSPPPPTTRLRPVNPRRAFGQSATGSGGGVTQIRASDSLDMRVCKSVMRDMLDEICGPDFSNSRPDGMSLSGGATASVGLDDFGFGGTSLKLEPTSDEAADGRTSADRLPSDQPPATGGGLSVQWQDQSIQHQRPDLEEVPQARIRPRVSSPVARQIVSMRDIYELPFDHIARHFKLEPHVVRFAYIQLKKHSFRSVGRPRKSESEERRHNAGDSLMMSYTGGGRLPSAGHSIASPSVPLRYPSDELNVFLDAYRKEVMKRRLALERRAEDEIGIVMPWNRGRSKNVKTTKRQIHKNANVEDAFPLCDPRYISLGGNTVPFEEMPMKMELDLSGNAKITTQSEMLNSNNNDDNSNTAATSGGGEENDESDEDDDNASPQLKTPRIGNDESENDSTDYNSSADESAAPQSSAKFASLATTKPAGKMTAAERKRVAQAEKRRERELKKAAKAVKAPKSRAVGQQQRRDRERRLQIMRKRSKASGGPARSSEEDSPTKSRGGAAARSNQSVAVVKRPTVQRSLHANNNMSDGIKNSKAAAKYCPCGGSYDPKKIYVSCQKCSRWYHSKCAGLTEKRAQKAASDPSAQWTCADCDKSASAELYCVCRRPYDDSKFYVGCDACEDWFHPECIGTTQAEVQKHDSFLCPKCQESDDI